MIIYGAILSPFVRKAMMFAGEKGIAFEHRPGGMGQGGEEFAAASAFGKMPALRDPGAGFDGGDYVLADSSAICAYLDAKLPANPLIPGEARARGEVVWLDEFADTILMTCGGKMFFNRVVSPVFLKTPGDLALAAAAEQQELPRILDWLDARIGDREFLVGDALTLADVSVVAPLLNIRHGGGAAAIAAHGNIARWMAAMEARPSIATTIAACDALMAKVEIPAWA